MSERTNKTTVPTEIVDRLNSMIGTTGRPRRILDGGQWHEMGCIEWPVPSRSALGPNSPLPELSHELRSLLAKIDRRLADAGLYEPYFREKLYFKRFREIFAAEAPEELKRELEKAAPQLHAIVVWEQDHYHQQYGPYY